MAIFCCKSAIACVFLWISIILFAVSFAVLEPHQFGIEVNGNSLQLNREVLFQGGRHFLGLGHSFYKLPANHVILSYSEYDKLGDTQKDGCLLDDECELQEGDCDYCLPGVPSSGTEESLVESQFLSQNPSLVCRTLEGLKVTVQAGIILKLGIYQETETETLQNGDDLFYPPQPKLKLSQSLLGLFDAFGEEPLELAKIAAESAIRDEVSQHNVYDFYEKRIEVLAQII